MTEVIIRNVTLLTPVQKFENNIKLVNLKFEAHVVQTFLELIKAHTVVEIDIEVSVSFSHTLESIRYLNPNQIKNSLKRTTLINHIVRRRPSISITAHKIENVSRIITQRQFLHWQINEQINNITKLHQVNFIAYLNLLQN